MKVTMSLEIGHKDRICAKSRGSDLNFQITVRHFVSKKKKSQKQWHSRQNAHTKCTVMSMKGKLRERECVH